VKRAIWLLVSLPGVRGIEKSVALVKQLDARCAQLRKIDPALVEYGGR
jgi:hypothetical protein